MIALWITVLALLMLAALACFKQADWHRRESNFWRRIALFDRAGMAPEDAPMLLVWAKTHKPRFFGRLRPWRDPYVRRRRASGIP